MGSQETPEEEKTSSMMSNGNVNLIMIGILGSLVGYVFYGHINLEAKVSVHEIQLKQDGGELDDLWGKYNDAGDKIGDFMIKDAKEKEQIKEEILRIELKDTERWMEYWKEKAQSKD